MKLPVYDLVSQQYIPGYTVTFRNTPLQKLYPDVEFAIGTAKEPNLKLAAQLIDAGFDGFKAVGASGSRKHGNVLFARNCDDAFTRYFGSNMNAINYGSNLVTECKIVETISVEILVVEDGEYGTGDCHAKCSVQFADYFNFLYHAAQFRAIAPKLLWMAKGTVTAIDTEWDLIIPVSAFKGNKVKPGEYKTEIVFGVKAISKNTPYPISYSVLQFFPWEAVEKDIVPKTVRAAKELNYISSSPASMLKEIDQAKENFSGLIAADKYNQLTTHPYVVSKLAEMHQQKWLQLCLGGAVKFASGMTQPDESLPDNYCYIPGLPEGEEVIVFPYPCRWKYDIRIWKNTHLPQWVNVEGILVANAKTLLDIGRDTDGDQLAWLPASCLPNIADAIRCAGSPPEEQPKPPKIPLQGTLGEIAVKSMCNDTGLITWLIAKCHALGMEYAVNALVPELQAAVDSLKGATPPHAKKISAISTSIKEEKVAWLAEYKKQITCKTQPFSDDGRTDTVSMLVREISKYWKPIEVRTTSLPAFLPIANQPNTRWLERAKEICAEYRKDLIGLYKVLKKYDVVPLAVQKRHDEMLSALFAKYRAKFAGLSPEQKEKAFDAFWTAQHNSNEGVASLSFVCFADVICERVKSLRIGRLRISPKYASYPDFVWQKQQVIATIQQDENGSYVVYHESGNIIGGLIINACPPVFLNIPMRIELYTRYNTHNRPSYVEAIVI
jgi:hypothetical protein